MRIYEPSDAILALHAAEYCALTLDENRFGQLKELARVIVWQSVAHAMPVRVPPNKELDLPADVTETMVATVGPEDIPKFSDEEAELLAEALGHLRTAKQADIEHAASPIGTALDRLKVRDHEAMLRHIDVLLNDSNVAA